MKVNLADFNWPLIIMIAVISASMSYVGDVLGKKIGKKRISLMRLRPRHTSTVVTTFTGIAVALLTLTIAACSSESVRIAVFARNFVERKVAEATRKARALQTELDDMTLELIALQNALFITKREKTSAEEEAAALRDETGKLKSETREMKNGLDDIMLKLTTSRNELSLIKREKAAAEEEAAALKAETKALRSEARRLAGEAEELKRGLGEMKSGRVILFQGEMLAQAPVEPDAAGNYAADGVIDHLTAMAEDYIDGKLAEMWKTGAGGRSRVSVAGEMRTGVAHQLVSAKGRKVLRLTAPSNIIAGQELEAVVSVFDSRLIFREDEILSSERIIGVTRQEDGSDLLYTILRRVNKSAVSRGVLPDPYSGKVGNLDSLDFFDVVDQIVACNGKGLAAAVAVIAADDIYTEGPVRVRIEVNEELGGQIERRDGANVDRWVPVMRGSKDTGRDAGPRRRGQDGLDLSALRSGPGLAA